MQYMWTLQERSWNGEVLLSGRILPAESQILPSSSADAESISGNERYSR